MEAADAAPLADRVATAMEKETDADRLRSLSDALAALAGRLEAADAARLANRGADRVATAMEQKETDADRLRSLSDALAALAGRLEAADAACGWPTAWPRRWSRRKPTLTDSAA